ncbi:uncharacterized protein LOC123877346 isoform X3 [Maniola jurtina]|uniref:uncharacterized protein LOC123877346 isoform X3 n=1 Tax=Maniola jurtina TaxID=191418 RepID=UPI001E68E7A6|nr:uncharacterized protein LOC123877346 isoform X3 [Maniola jurtina]
MDVHTMAMASTSNVIKLEGQKNWNVWKFQVAVTLRGADVFLVVNGTEKSDEKNMTEWAKKDVKAQTIIVSRLSEAAMVHVLTCETAAEMWQKLHSVFEAKSATSTMMLQQRFLQCKFEDGELSVFLAKVQQMATGNSRVKHLEIKQAFVKEKLENKIIELRYINTSEQLADILTKALGGIAFKRLRGKLF